MGALVAARLAAHPPTTTPTPTATAIALAAAAAAAVALSAVSAAVQAILRNVD